MLRNRWLLRALIVLGVALLAIQLVPYRVSNPSARQEPPWDSPRTRTLAVAACFDCHSNETNVLAFERVAPLGLHSNAQLTKADKQQLIDGLRKTYAAAGMEGG